MTLLVLEWSLKSSLHNATIDSVLRELAGSLFHKFGFFMDCLRIFFQSNEKYIIFQLIANELNNKILLCLT